MKHMISQIRPGSTNESLLWHNYKKIFYFDSFVLQNLICTAYHFWCPDLHCIAFLISFISVSDLNRFPGFCKSYVIWMRWVYKMKHMISQIRPGSTNESLLWHNYKKIFYFDSFVLQNLICTAYDFLCLNLHFITFRISYISASDLNRFARFCGSYVIWMSWVYKMKHHMISQIRPGNTNESDFWQKIFYFDSFVLQNLICTAYDFLCLDLHCITFQISYISKSDLNRFPRFCKSHAIWMSWVYKSKHVISQMRPGSTNESLFWHNHKKIYYFDSFVLQNLICTAYDFLCLSLYCITFEISYISASDLNRFPRSCKSHAIWMSWMYKMKHMISQIRSGSTNESLFGIITKNIIFWLIFTTRPHLHCIWLFMPGCALHIFSDFWYFCIGVESFSKIL